MKNSGRSISICDFCRKRGAYGNEEKEYQYGIREQDEYRGGHYCAAGGAEGATARRTG
ncbi:MAG: hypothetical protein HFH89_05045 [Lachnospiraceae bacterium]|nr:hypothetical protein [uncultured Acetatifactor sp.]MCI8287016.1 hypothetical protein [Lachnospiraceae bacterium]